jgi:hypothetical protein
MGVRPAGCRCRVAFGPTSSVCGGRRCPAGLRRRPGRSSGRRSPPGAGRGEQRRRSGAFEPVETDRPAGRCRADAQLGDTPRCSWNANQYRRTVPFGQSQSASAWAARQADDGNAILLLTLRRFERAHLRLESWLGCHDSPAPRGCLLWRRGWRGVRNGRSSGLGVARA